MKTASASPADGRSAAAPAGRKLVWDAPVRVFHWLTVLSFSGAWLSAESERWRLLHVTLGYTLVGLVIFRLVWGLVGTRHARFADFVRGPAAVLAHLRTLFSGHAEHTVGHNPAGGWAIIALLLLALGVGASGWALFNGVGGDALEELHEWVAQAMLLVVAVHITGVLLGSWLQRENLVTAMWTGTKAGRPEDGIQRAWLSVAAALLLAVAAFWWLQWQSAPGNANAPAAAVGAAATDRHRDDDDD